MVSGDGDLVAIGGNHLIQNARRNVEMVVLCINNGIYGMTGGQAAPTTPMGIRTTTTPYGTVENTFNISKLVMAAGASFVACWTTAHPRQLTNSIKKAIRKKGFAFIEVFSQCPIQFGRKTGLDSAVQMMEDYNKRSISLKEAAKLSEEELKDRIIVGELIDIEKPEMVEEIEKMKKRASGGVNESYRDTHWRSGRTRGCLIGDTVGTAATLFEGKTGRSDAILQFGTEGWFSQGRGHHLRTAGFGPPGEKAGYPDRHGGGSADKDI